MVMMRLIIITYFVRIVMSVTMIIIFIIINSIVDYY